jgi:hypothetical protein
MELDVPQMILNEVTPAKDDIVVHGCTNAFHFGTRFFPFTLLFPFLFVQIGHYIPSQGEGHGTSRNSKPLQIANNIKMRT